MPRPSLAAFLARQLALVVTLLIQISATGAILAPPVIAPLLLARLGVGDLAIGIYIAAAYLAAAVSSVYAAAVILRWGPIRASQAALGLCALGLVLIASHHAGFALAGAVALGIGYGPITPASSEILARTTPPERYALVFSLKQTGVPLGGALAGAAAAPLAAYAGTGTALGFMAALCVLAAALAQPLRHALDDGRNPAAPWPTLTSFLQPIRMVLAHRGLRMLAICSFVYSSMQMCLGSYLVSYLHAGLGWTLVAAGGGMAATQAGGVIGRVLWGAVADRTGRTIGTLRALGAAMALASVTMALLSPTAPALAVLALLCAFGSTAIGWNGVYLAAVARNAAPGAAGIATAGCLFFTYLGVVVAPPLFGAASDAFGGMGIAFALLAVPIAAVAVFAREHRAAST